MEIAQTSLENFIVRCLATTGWTDEHQTMTDLYRVVQLKDLIDEGGSRLEIQVRILTDCAELSGQITVFVFGAFDARE